MHHIVSVVVLKDVDQKLIIFLHLSLFLGVLLSRRKGRLHFILNGE